LNKLSGRALKVLSYCLLLSGALLLSPFLLMLLTKVAPIALPLSLFGALFVGGSIAVCLTLLAIPACGIWIQTKSTIEDLKAFYKISLIRFAPVAVAGLIHIYAGRHFGFNITGLFALSLIIYGGWLLVQDRERTTAERA